MTIAAAALGYNDTNSPVESSLAMIWAMALRHRDVFFGGFGFEFHFLLQRTDGAFGQVFINLFDDFRFGVLQRDDQGLGFDRAQDLLHASILESQHVFKHIQQFLQAVGGLLVGLPQFRDHSHAGLLR